MAEDSDEERTESPSPRKLEKAREEGNVPRSRDLDTFVLLMLIGGSLWFSAGTLFGQFNALLSSSLSMNRETLLDPALLLVHLGVQISNVLLAFLPMVALLIVCIIGLPALTGGWLFSAKALVPNFNRLNPLNWLGNLFSSHSVVEVLKAIAKAGLVGTSAWFVMRSEEEAFLGLAYEPLDESAGHMASLLWTAYFSIVGTLGVIALIDATYQRWHYLEKLKMTKEELKQESKESEGDPQVKGRIRALQRAMARRRMMAEVPTADVVVTNPTHFAVALKYDRDADGAPVVVAKGQDKLAEKIRELAGRHGVPVLEAPMLARSLHAHVELGQAIPVGLYTAVAEVIAYVYQLRSYRQEGGAQPDVPVEFDIPKELAVPAPQRNGGRAL